MSINAIINGNFLEHEEHVVLKNKIYKKIYNSALSHAINFYAKADVHSVL